jgi:hypothetical protein
MARVANYEEIYKFFRNGALSDAKHDFTNTSKGVSADHYNVIKEGLYNDPAIETAATNEDSFLASVFEGKTIDDIKNEAKAAPEKMININVKGLTPSKYTVKVLHKGGVANIDKIITGKLLTLTDIKDFFNSPIINILVDASAIGIMNLISSLKLGAGAPAAADAEKLFINLILNRECINDPGGKITEFKKLDPSVKGHLETDVLIDRDVSEILYNKNSAELNNTPLERDKFFSKYNFKMGPVMYQENKAGSLKAKFVSTKVDVLDSPGKKLLYTVTDKNENSVTKCWKKISSFFKKDDILTSIIFQMKRSGDWLQALSCLDLKRNYGSTKSGKIDVINGSITLVTHDKILLAYALFIGIDVIFTNLHNGEKNVFYFYNNTSETRLSPADLAKYLEDIAEDLLKKKAAEDEAVLKATAEYVSGPLEAHLKFMSQYMGWVEEIKEAQKKLIGGAMAETKTHGTNSYFKKLWEYTAINYRSFNNTEKTLKDLHEEYNKDATPEICKRLLSMKADLDSCMTDTKDTIIAGSRGYVDDPGYKIMDSPKTIIRGRESDNINKRLITMVDKFSKELPADLFKRFRNACIESSEELKEENANFLIHTLAVLLKGVKSVYEIEGEAEAVAEAVAEAEAEPVAEAPKLTESDAEIIADLTNSLVPEDGEIIEGTQVLGALAQLIADYRYVDYRNNNDASIGGGKREIGANHLTNIGFSFLINIFLSKMYSNLSEIDSHNNFDYFYYKQLIAYIQVYFAEFPDARDRAYILYVFLTKNHNLPSSVLYLANQISIDAIGGSGKDLYKMNQRKFINKITPAELKRRVRTKFNTHILTTFARSKRGLLKYLQEQFEEVKILEEEEEDLAPSTPERRNSRKRGRVSGRSGSLNRNKTAKIRLISTPERGGPMGNNV